MKNSSRYFSKKCIKLQIYAKTIRADGEEISGQEFQQHSKGLVFCMSKHSKNSKNEPNMRNEAENKKNGGDFRDVKNDKPEIKSEKGMEQNRSK